MNEATGTVIHQYPYPLGGPRWLNCTYRKTADGYRWEFSRGGGMTPEQWPEVIASGLAGTRRFGGRSLTDARHSDLLARYLQETGYGPGAQMLALIHDASEVLGAGDMNSRLKRLIGQALRSYEDDLLEFLITDLGIGHHISDSDRSVVHAADKLFGEAEARIMDFQHGLPWLVSLDNEVFVWLSRAMAQAPDRRPTDRDAYLWSWARVWGQLKL